MVSRDDGLKESCAEGLWVHEKGPSYRNIGNWERETSQHAGNGFLSAFAKVSRRVIFKPPGVYSTPFTHERKLKPIRVNKCANFVL